MVTAAGGPLDDMGHDDRGYQHRRRFDAGARDRLTVRGAVADQGGDPLQIRKCVPVVEVEFDQRSRGGLERVENYETGRLIRGIFRKYRTSHDLPRHSFTATGPRTG